MDFLWKNFFLATEENTKTQILAHNPLFQSLNPKEQNLLVQTVHERSYIRGEPLFPPGKGLGMYLVLQGKVSILYHKGNSPAKTVSELSKGGFFGELALVKDKAYQNLSAQASEKSQLLCFLRPDLLSLMDKQPLTAAKILMNLSKIIGERLLKASEKLFHTDQKMEL